MSERVESMNATPAMFRAGISAKFTTRRGDNFHDTTLTAASAAKQRAERRAEKHAEAIDKQQKKVESEMKKIEEIAQRLHQRQVREAKRLRGRLHFAATRIQSAFRRSRACWRETQALAATRIQSRWRCVCARTCADAKRAERQERKLNCAAAVITRTVRVYACRLMREQMFIEREYAATLIQSIVRMATTKRSVATLQQARRDELERHRAAICIQSNMKAFMTRLIYLDVLYVICRIQAVVRGFLIRRRLQWVAAIDIDGISKFQALARGFLTRMQLRRCGWRGCSSGQELGDKANVYGVDDQPVDDSGITKSASRRSSEDVELQRHTKKAKAKIATKPSLQVEVAVKRSYWLPAGASFSKRLPGIAVKRALAIDLDDSDDESDELPGSGLLNHRPGVLGTRTPKKRNQKSRPPRLAPMTPPLAAVGNGRKCPNTSPRILTETECELMQATQALEDRQKREEELKQKLLSRRLLEKRKAEHEQRLKREQESEENERKLMEREEKLARLLLKVQHRRSKEVRIKKQTVEQHREERERIAMAREERQARLLAKLAARQAQMKKNAACISAAASAAGGSNTAHTSTTTLAARTKGSRSRTELHPTTESALNNAKSAASDPQDDDNDDDMSFLDIGFKIPESMQRSKVATKGVGSKNAKGRLNKATKSSSRSDKRTMASHSTGLRRGERNNQEEISLDAVKRDGIADSAASDVEFDYGNEFEEVIDEAELGRLIC